MGVLVYNWEAYSLEGRMGENTDKCDEKSIAINWSGDSEIPVW